MADTSVNLDDNDREIISFINSHKKNVIVLLNKSDLPTVVTEEEISQIFEEFSIRELEMEKDQIDKNKINEDRTEKNIVEESRVKEVIIEEHGVNKNRKVVMIKSSTKVNSGLEELEKTIKDIFFQGEIKSSNEIIITNMRHKEALQEAYGSLKLVKKKYSR